MSKQTTATISLNADDKKELMEHAKSVDMGLSKLLVTSAFDAMKMKKITIQHDGAFILVPEGATPDDLRKAASMLELLGDAE